MHQLWMRRILIAVLVVALGHGAVAAGRNVAITNPISDQGLRVIDAASPDFMPEIKQLLDPLAIKKAQPFLTKSVVIANDTGKYVWGFTVIFTFPEQISPSGNPWRHIISPSPGGPAPHEAMLPPGGRYLVTPVPGFHAFRQASGEHRLRPYLDESMNHSIQLFLSQHSSDLERVEISVDSIIYEDGVIDGPDVAERQSEINDQIKAHKDVTILLQKLKGAALKEKLAALSNTDTVDHYSMRLNRLAALLQKRLEQQGEDVVLQDIEHLKVSKWFPNADHIQRKAK